jgi:hypothetical protein
LEGAGLPLSIEPSTLLTRPFHGPLNGPTVRFQRPGKGLGSLCHVIVKVLLEVSLSPAAEPFYNPFNTALEAVVSFNPAPRHTTEIQYG